MYYFFVSLLKILSSLFIIFLSISDALYRYLKNKHANDGLHIGGSAGFGLGGAGSKIPFGLPASIKTALGSSEPVWETGK